MPQTEVFPEPSPAAAAAVAAAAVAAAAVAAAAALVRQVEVHRRKARERVTAQQQQQQHAVWCESAPTFVRDGTTVLRYTPAIGTTRSRISASLAGVRRHSFTCVCIPSKAIHGVTNK